MQKPHKSARGLLLESLVPAQTDKMQYIMDGGHLLESVTWPHLMRYRDVCHCDIPYTLTHCGAGKTIVSDGCTSDMLEPPALRVCQCTDYLNAGGPDNHGHGCEWMCFVSRTPQLCTGQSGPV